MRRDVAEEQGRPVKIKPIDRLFACDPILNRIETKQAGDLKETAFLEKAL
jgi:hypothetical protein